MSDDSRRSPILDEIFRRLVDDEDTAAFIHAVAGRYATTTLERLARRGSRITRRAAVLALGYLARYESNPVLGRALRDPDRGVRMLADNAIRQVWLRAGGAQYAHRLNMIVRLIQDGDFERAVLSAGQLIDEAPWLAEAWNRRAVALFQLGRYDDSVSDCQQTLELNPIHFGAAVIMARCRLRRHDARGALSCFRRALRINPSLEAVRLQVAKLSKARGI